MIRGALITLPPLHSGTGSGGGLHTLLTTAIGTTFVVTIAVSVQEARITRPLHVRTMVSTGQRAPLEAAIGTTEMVFGAVIITGALVTLSWNSNGTLSFAWGHAPHHTAIVAADLFPSPTVAVAAALIASP